MQNFVLNQLNTPFRRKKVNIPKGKPNNYCILVHCIDGNLSLITSDNKILWSSRLLKNRATYFENYSSLQDPINISNYSEQFQDLSETINTGALSNDIQENDINTLSNIYPQSYSSRRLIPTVDGNLFYRDEHGRFLVILTKIYSS